MMRSEKRARPSVQRSPEACGGRPPRRRRTGAGIPYKILTVLLLLVLWPIGLFLLWNRRLRWSGLTKLFTSIITLMACILLIGFALTVETHNPQFTAIQNRANSALDSAADAVIDFSVDMGERASTSLDALDDIRFAYRSESLNRAADAIEWSVNLAQSAKDHVTGFFASISVQPDDAQDATAAPSSNTGSPAPKEDETAAAPTETAAVRATPTPRPTSAPAATIRVGADGDEFPIYIPEATPEAGGGEAIASGILRRSGELEAGALPTATPEPEPEDLTFAVKPAGEAVVYFNIGSGKYYHMAPVCGSMKSADTHSFAEVAENIHEPCSRCTPPEKALLDEKYIVWLDENGLAHLTDECADFAGQWSLLSADDAIETKREGCPVCSADRYLAALADGLELTLTEPGAAPAADATPEPAAED